MPETFTYPLTALVLIGSAILAGRLVTATLYTRVLLPVLAVAGLAGLAWQLAALPLPDGGTIRLMAELGLAALVFQGCLHARLSKLLQHARQTRRFSGISALLLFATAGLSAFILLPSLGLVAALMFGLVLALGGPVGSTAGARDRPAIPALSGATRLIQVESSLTLIFFVPIALLAEALVTQLSGAAGPRTMLEVWALDSTRIVAGFVVGGAVALLLARYRPGEKVAASVITLLLALAAATISQANLVFAALGAGLIWSEENAMAREDRGQVQTAVQIGTGLPLFMVFGFLLGPHLLRADLLVIILGFAGVTLLRVFARVISSGLIHMPEEARGYAVWFGATPGPLAALFLLYLMDSPVLADQDLLLTLGTVAVVLSMIAVAASRSFLVSHFAREAELARRKRYFAKG